ncbi:uncharacterized protein DEA37_0006703 [Paragonimus westermani]|uniref:Uncharacterized protein n=1 Tax=Paragonimus westermani TaxID=34504 RepID=A0A5J4NAC3_9TREM|nr:uncharacterized protein DEA37_0006703 [Paragonimus westermani]
MWVLLFLVYNSVVITIPVSASELCPSSCKCGPSEGLHEIPNEPNRTESVVTMMAECWIPANLPQLSCSADWDILHLQILSGKSEPVSRNVTSTTPSMQVTVSPELFVNCGSITRLAIWERSQFTALPRYILRPLINLTRLVIQVPSLVRLPDYFLAFLPKLSFVMISSCRELQTIGRLVFEACPVSLKTVWLSGNRLSGKLPAGLFRQCDLRTLWLSDNQLESLDWGSLRGLSELISLRLDKNRMNGSLARCLGYRSDVKSSALKATPMLKILDLSSNWLISIEDFKWSGMCEQTADVSTQGLCYLEELNLSQNQLHWIGPTAFSGLPRLERLMLEGNLKLYSSESLSGFAVALYAIGVNNKRLTKLIIPVPYEDNTTGTGTQTRQSRVLNVCGDRDQMSQQLLPRSLNSVIVQLNHSSCGGTSKVPHIPSTTTLSSKQSTIKQSTTECAIDSCRNQPVELMDLEKEGPVVNFIRQMDRINLLFVCLGLILFGILLGLIPFCLIRLFKRDSHTGPKLIGQASVGPIQIHPGQRMCYFRTPSSPGGSHGSPLPMRTVAKETGQPIMLTSLQNQTTWIPVNNTHFSPINYSSEQIRVKPPQQNLDEVYHARRVNSTGNVYHRIGRPRTRRSNVQQGNPMNGQFHIQLPPRPAFSQGPLIFQQPLERRPLLRSSIGTRTDSMYQQTVETTLGGSVYSLATLTSHRNRTPTVEQGVPQTSP